MRRERFLETFFVALGARKILWTNKNDDSISGIILFDLINSEERQEFIWHMTENEVPNDQIKDLITFLTKNQLIDRDKVKLPIKEIAVPNCDIKTKEKIFNILFKIKVNMIDNGIESDFFCIHD
jgi:hypothetical protein